MAVAVLPLARFLILTFYSTTKVSHQSCFDRSRRTHVIAVLALAVDLRGDRDDLVAVLVGLSAGPEADVKPSTLEEGNMSVISKGRRRQGTYTASAGTLLDGTRRRRRRDDRDEESEKESDNGKARHGR